MHPEKDKRLIQINEQEISYRKNFLLWMNEEHFHPKTINLTDLEASH